MLSKMHHIALEVSDAERSAEFYCNLLGFTRGNRHDFPDRGRVIIFVSLGGVSVELLQGSEPDAHVAQPKMIGFKHLCFKTDDIDAEIERLRQAGVTITTEPFDTEINSRIAFFEDPDGLPLELWQDAK